MLHACLSMFTNLNIRNPTWQFFEKYILYIYKRRKKKREEIMSEFGYGNLLSSVQKKIFPNGVAYDIMQRLDSMTVFNEEVPENLDSFDKHTNSVESRAMRLFNSVDCNDIDAMKIACRDAGMFVKVDSVETEYIADKEETGSMSVYTFTDARGNEISITNANAKECIEQERVAFDDVLKGVVDEIATGQIELPASPYAEDEQEAA